MIIGWIIGGVVVVLVGLLLLGRRLTLALPSRAEAIAQFETHREQLLSDFFDAASSSGKPRGLRWKHCDWEENVELALDVQQHRLIAMLGVTIQFEAIEGSDMEGLPAVGNLRNATGLFIYERGRWHASGRAVFNLNPDEVISHFSQQYERYED